MVIKGNFQSYPSHFLLPRINFFPSTNNPESCHMWQNIVVLKIRKRNSTAWEWSWMSFSCMIFNLRTKTFLRELQKSNDFSISPTSLTYHKDWTLISPEKLYLPKFLKKSFPNFLKEISRLLPKFLPHWMAEWNQMRVLSQKNIKGNSGSEKENNFDNTDL